MFNSDILRFYNPNPGTRKFFGGLTCVCGLIIATKFSFMGAFLALFGVAYMTSHYGILLNPKEKLYKEYFYLFGLKIGSWRKLPLNSFILLKKLSDSANLSSVFRGEFTARVYYYKLFLNCSRPKVGIELIAHEEEEEINKIGKEMARLLEIPLKVDQGRKV